jgi:hypothetical protein
MGIYIFILDIYVLEKTVFDAKEILSFILQPHQPKHDILVHQVFLYLFYTRDTRKNNGTRIQLEIRKIPKYLQNPIRKRKNEFTH